MIRRRSVILLLLTCLIALVAAVLYDPRRSLPGSEAFAITEDFGIYNVFDAGIADLNGDGRIDRWTVNHSSAQWVKFGSDRQIDSDTGNDIDVSGLYQDPNLPGFEAGLGPISTLRPIRIYMREAHFVVEADRLMHGDSVKGYFDIPWRTEYEVFDGASVSETQCDTIPNCHRLVFEVPEGGRVEMLPVPSPSDGFPVIITLDPETELSNVQLGAGAIEPTSHEFTYHSRDRHSLAMAELPGKTRQVLFVSRGGARGRLPDVHPDARDELFEWTESGFQDTIGSYGIEKGGCPGRQAGWYDVSGDGRLDLYQVCGRNAFEADNTTARNRLYVQQPDGSFVEDAASFGLDFPGVGVFRFVPRVQEKTPSALLWVTEGEVALFEQGDAGFEQLWRLEAPVTGTEKVILNDLATKGVWDAFIFSPRGNLLFPISREAPLLRDIQALGLPLASADGAIADFDGDGFRDVLAVPQGIFLHDGDHFEATDLIDLSWADNLLEVRIVPLDYDNDSDLDLWVLVQGANEVSRIIRAVYNRSPAFLRSWIEKHYGRDRLLPRYWRSVLYENLHDKGQLHILRPKGMPGHANGFGKSFLSKVRMPTDASNLQNRYLFTGMDDPSRFSQTFPDIFLSLPEGAALVSVEPLQSDSVDVRH
jgi:hypothetical protein